MYFSTVHKLHLNKFKLLDQAMGLGIVKWKMNKKFCDSVTDSDF